MNVDKTSALPENTSAEQGRPESGASHPAAVRAKDRLGMAVVLSGASIAWLGWGHQGLQLEGWLRAGMVAGALALMRQATQEHV